MTRLVWIPVAGTLAAAVAIALTHAPREEASAPAVPPRSERPPAAPEEYPANKPPAPAQPPQPEPDATVHVVRLYADGELEEVDTGRRFAGAQELIDTLAPADDDDVESRPRIVVTNASPDVAEADLDAVLAKLRGRFDVRKDYSVFPRGD